MTMTSMRLTLFVIAVVLANALQCTALATPANGGASHQVVPVKEVFVVTHAAGRMGKLLALQIKEDAEIEGRRIPTIRAVVRSEAEAMSVKCDLGGMSLTGATAAPNPLDWLETVVADADVGSAALGSTLRMAFEGATYACLCSEAHNELAWDEDVGGHAIRVPAAESRDLSDRLLPLRLLSEIDAAARSATLRHTLLRSSMGLAGPADGAGGRAMGGAAALDAPRAAEARAARALERFTVLRLGALTDDPGMVPLIFGQDDAILQKRLDGGGRPPIISRADAARASAFLMKEPRSFNRMVIDCAWHPKFGRSSVGTEEAKMMAARQDLKRDILSMCDVGGGVTAT